MTYHSDNDIYGFRKNEILPLLAKHGIVVDIDVAGEAVAESAQSAVEPPEWKVSMARRRRLSVMEAACLLAGMNPYTDTNNLGYGSMDDVPYDMNKALLDEAIEDGLIQVFEKWMDSNHMQSFIEAEDFAEWCDRTGIPRPLPWNFEKILPATDAGLRQLVEEQRQQLAQAAEEIERLQRVNENLTADIDHLREEIARLQANPSSGKTMLSNNLSFRYETVFLKLAAEVQDRYFGDNYDPNDPDTRPRKDHVVEWLKNRNSDLTKPDLQAIDRVAMPFKRGK